MGKYEVMLILLAKEFDAKKCSPSYVAFLDAVGAVAKTTQLVADIEGPLSS